MPKLNKVRASALNQKGVIAPVILLLLLLAGIFVGVWLITNGNPLKLFSRAGGSWLIIRDQNGVPYPQEGTVIKINSASVKLEFYAPYGLKPNTTVSGPVKVHTVSYKIAEDPTSLTQAPAVPMTQDPTQIPWTFKDPNPGQKFIWGEFAQSDGTTIRNSAEIELLGLVGPTTSFVLSPNANSVKVGDEVAVKLVVRSDVAAANLFTAKINFSQDLLAVDSIDYSNSLIKNWVEQFSDNATGTISLVGGVPNPGFQTTTGSAGVPMAVIYFKALKSGTANISFADNSAIYSNADNINIITNKESISLSVTTGEPPAPSATPAPSVQVTVNSVDTSLGVGSSSPIFQIIAYNGVGSGIQTYPVASMQKIRVDTRTAKNQNIPNAYIQDVILLTDTGLTAGTYTGTIAVTNSLGQIVFSIPLTVRVIAPTPSATPIPGSGDANRDGKVDLVDLSILLTDFNKNRGFRTGIDLNGDGVINTFDFSLMRNLLIQKGIIRGARG